MKQYLLVLSLLLLTSCTHTINFRASHFATPVVAEQQWSGHVAGVGSGVTKITVVNDITTNPPLRNSVEINKDTDVADMLGISYLSLDASLHIWNGTEIYLDGSLVGLRYQFLNHGKGEGLWVGALQGAFGERSVSTSSTSSGIESKADSKVTTSQAGISLGYKVKQVVPYFSYIYEAHEVSTKVVNGGGSFGPYADKGNHQYYSLGISSHERGFTYAVEYNLIAISWENSESTSQSTVGAKLGYAW